MAAQETIRIPGDRPRCEECTIVLEEFARIGGPADTLGLISTDASRVQLWNEGRQVVVSPSLVPSVIAIYDLAGGSPRTIGREGGGPGEYRRIQAVVVDSTNRFHAFADGRETIVTPDGALIETRAAPGTPHGILSLSAGVTLLHAFVPTRDRAGYPLHLIDDNGIVTRSFGPASRGPEFDRDFFRILAHSGPGQFWAAQNNRYRLVRWDTSGTRLVEVERTPSWFEPWDDWVGPWEGRPPPRLTSVYEDDDGRVWVMLWVADDEFRPVRRDEVDIRSSIGDGDHPLYDTIIEVLDIETGTLLLHQRFGRMLSGFRPGGVVLGWDDTPAGHQIISFYRARIDDPVN